MNIKFSLLKLNKHLVFQCHEVTQSENKVVLIGIQCYLVRIGDTTKIDLANKQIVLSFNDSVFLKYYTNNDYRDVEYNIVMKILKTWSDAC